MARIAGFGAYLPARVLTNQALAEQLVCTPDWIREASGIEERRVAGDETIPDMAHAAAQDCLTRSGLSAAGVGLILLASGSGERRFPGHACELASRLGMNQTPALDVPMASAGSLFGMSMASHMAEAYGSILVVAAEKMSAFATREPLDKNVAILFGDGAGACLITRDTGPLRIIGSILHTDGAFAADLRLSCEGQLTMNGRSVIMQAWRRIPTVIAEVLDRHQVPAASVSAYLLHQANQNLIERIARTLEVPAERFYSNIARFGNTSSASMLIAAHEWWDQGLPAAGSHICFAAFGAGFHWGALLAETS